MSEENKKNGAGSVEAQSPAGEKKKRLSYGRRYGMSGANGRKKTEGAAAVNSSELKSPAGGSQKQGTASQRERAPQKKNAAPKNEQTSKGSTQQNNTVKTANHIEEKNSRTKAAPAKNSSVRAGSGETNTAAKQERKTRRSGGKKTPLRIIPLGGLGEIGKNLTVYECGGDMLIVDCGMAFPDDEMLGIDIVIPDFTYLLNNREKIRGVVLTHGHEDHIGGLPYLLKVLNVPIYGTRLTLGLVEGKLREHGLLGGADLTVVRPGDTVPFGCMSAEYINVNHSIPDACAIAIHTPAGVVVQTGDFKIDYTPIVGDMIDLARFGELGRSGVLALLSDSTNAERPGSTLSERKVGESFETLFKTASTRRIIIATFSSNIHRVQQIVNTAHRFGRKVAISGRSMINVVGIAMELGYLKIPDGLLIDINALKRYADDQIVIITTGSQGEAMSALTRMSMSEHRQVAVTRNDFIIISATPIPGNEKLVGRVVNDLMKLGAEVVYERMYEVHVSGHANQDELKLMLSLTRPQFFFPVHGEYKHLKKHAGLALGMGMPEERICISEIGRVAELNGETLKTAEVVPSGRVMVDGLGVGDVGSVVMRDRKHLSEDGLFVVAITIKKGTHEILAGPDIVSRGFVYVRESEEMMREARKIAKSVLEEQVRNGQFEWNATKLKIRDAVDSFLYHQTKRSPMILPIIQEI